MGKRKSQEVRIIGGKWRGRKLRFHSTPDLRPTLGRMRETLFNWLRPEITGTHCLDLFAGSGILGFEALSQGASKVTLVDSHRAATDQMRLCAQTLQTTASVEVRCQDALSFLRRSADTYWDIVFLDPPYKTPGLLIDAITVLATKPKPPRWLYIESRDVEAIQLNLAGLGFDTTKSTRAGDAQALLCQFNSARDATP
ncbi:MAG: 16S rRNA (guanine(966)-N(2))-methyltransferase RsmD [Pseudomonadales bacterium]|nr:16S rRNA (guanine(966)-N(2))-methyltransferase RsmD [Pseudomonadales bacterium]